MTPLELLERWLQDVISTPGLTALRDPGDARRMLLEDALRGVPVVSALPGPVVDVGSGGGTPGIPLAVSLPDREVALLEAQRRKCEFLRRWEAQLDNVSVVWGRAEDQPTDVYGAAVAKALAQPAVAAELCLPLVRPGGAAVLWVGPNADVPRVEAVAVRLAGRLEPAPTGFLVLRKEDETPPGFPRRAGMAAKRPLA